MGRVTVMVMVNDVHTGSRVSKSMYSGLNLWIKAENAIPSEKLMIV
jgi:hypothetical protein